MKLMKTPKSLQLAITNRCNLRCTYCSYFSSPADVDHDLPKQEWLTFFEELRRCAVMKVTLEGGEPFIRKDLKDIIHGIVQNQMRFSVLSNGTLITDDIAAYLASTKRCEYVQVSIDGSAPEIHDACRGDGNFFKAAEGVRTLQKHGVPVTVRVTIHKYGVDDLERVAQLLLEDFELPGFSTNSASHFGLCRQHADDVQLTVEDSSRAMEALLTLNKKYNGRISATAGPLAEARMWLKMEQARQEGKENIPGRGYLTSCNGVFQKLDVRADGMIVPCSQMGHVELGRINQDDLRDLWQNHPELTRLRERHHIPLSNFEFCKGCAYIPYCAGGCPALAYTIVGKDEHPSPDSCLKRFLEHGGRLPDDIA